MVYLYSRFMLMINFLQQDVKVLMIHMPAVDFTANSDKLFNKVLETVSTNTSNKTDTAHNQTKYLPCGPLIILLPSVVV